jgi:hypothetical protein
MEQRQAAQDMALVQIAMKDGGSSMRHWRLSGQHRIPDGRHSLAFES